MNNNLQKKGSGFALLPFAIFIIIYLGAGLYLQAKGEEMAFYQFPSVTAMFIALIVAFCMGKESIDEKFSIFSLDFITVLSILRRDFLECYSVH